MKLKTHARVNELIPHIFAHLLIRNKKALFIHFFSIIVIICQLYATHHMLSLASNIDTLLYKHAFFHQPAKKNVGVQLQSEAMAVTRLRGFPSIIILDCNLNIAWLWHLTLARMMSL